MIYVPPSAETWTHFFSFNQTENQVPLRRKHLSGEGETMSIVGRWDSKNPVFYRCILQLHANMSSLAVVKLARCGQTGSASFSVDARHLSIAQPFLHPSHNPPLSTYRKHLTRMSFHPPQNAERAVSYRGTFPWLGLYVSHITDKTCIMPSASPSGDLIQ